MSGDEPRRDWRVKFTERSTERLAEWAEHATEEDYGLVVAALMSVTDGSWLDRWGCHPDASNRLTWYIQVTSDLEVTVRFSQEYPNTAQLIDIGPP